MGILYHFGWLTDKIGLFNWRCGWGTRGSKHLCQVLKFKIGGITGFIGKGAIRVGVLISAMLAVQSQWRMTLGQEKVILLIVVGFFVVFWLSEVLLQYGIYLAHHHRRL